MAPNTIQKQILARIVDIQRELDIRKALYDELDMLTIQLQAEGFKSAEINDLVVSLVDNFEVSNTVFRPAGVKRYEIKVESKETVAKRQARAESKKSSKRGA